MNENENLNEELNEEEQVERDDEFEYDEEGNIIIPEPDNDPTETTDEEDAAEEDDGAEEEATDDQGNEEKPAADDGKDAKIDELTKQLEALTAKNSALTAQSKATLKALGVENTDDVVGALEKLAAETEGVDLAEYKARKLEKQRNEEAQKVLKNLEFERVKQADLKAVKDAYPELADIGAITDIKNFQTFAKYRALGVPAVQAYAAANVDSIRESAAILAKQKTLNDTKSHLKSNVPKGAVDVSDKPTKEEMRELRELFPDKSDKELLALHKQIS